MQWERQITFIILESDASKAQFTMADEFLRYLYILLQTDAKSTLSIIDSRLNHHISMEKAK